MDIIRQTIASETSSVLDTVSSASDHSMLDFFTGYVGILNSSEFVSGGAQMSQDTGKKFAAGMLKKRSEGKL